MIKKWAVPSHNCARCHNERLRNVLVLPLLEKSKYLTGIFRLLYKTQVVFCEEEWMQQWPDVVCSFYQHQYQASQSQPYSNNFASLGPMILWWTTAKRPFCCEPASVLCCWERGACTGVQPACRRVMWAGIGGVGVGGDLQRGERKWEIGATVREQSLSAAALLPAAPCLLQMRNFRHPAR